MRFQWIALLSGGIKVRTHREGFVESLCFGLPSRSQNETERTTLGCRKNTQYSESEQWIPGKKPLGIPWNLPFFFPSPFWKHIYGACYRVHAIITSIPVLNAVNFKPDKGLNETRESACCTAPRLYITCAYECLCKRRSKSDKKLQMNKCMHHL